MNEMDRQDFLKFRELDDARWELIPDMESDDARTVRGAVARVRALAEDAAQDASWLSVRPMARRWIDELARNAEQAAERMREDPEWKLLDAVEGKKE